MKKKLSFLIMTVFVLSFLMQSFINPSKVSAMDILKVIPKEISNESLETDILIEGFNFKEYSKVYLYNEEIERELEKVEVYSENQIRAKLKGGLDEGIYSIRIEHKDKIATVISQAIKIYGKNIELRVKSLEKEIIGNNVVKYSIETNIPVKAKARMGDTYPTEMKVVMKKTEYSTKHILTFVFDTDAPRYQMAELILRSEKGEEISITKTLKLTKDGVKVLEEEPFSFSHPVLKKDKDGLIVLVNSSQPVKLRLESKKFEEESWQFLQEKDEYNKENKLWILNLVTDESHYLKVLGKTESGENEFEEEFKFYYTEFEEIEEEKNIEDQEIGEEKFNDSEEEEIQEQIIIDETYIEKREEEIKEEFYIDFDESNNWAIDYALKLAEEGIVRKDKPEPKRDITNKEVALMLERKLNKDKIEDESEEVKSYFTDISSTDPVHDALSFLVEKEITKGYNDGTFRPDEKITRKGASKMLLKALNIEAEDSLSFVVEKEWLEKTEEEYLTRAKFFKLFALAFDMADTVEITDYKLQITNEEEKVEEQKDKGTEGQRDEGEETFVDMSEGEKEEIDSPLEEEILNDNKVEEDEEEIGWDDLEAMLGDLL